MKKFLSLLTLCSIFTTFSLAQEPFEGIITYKVETTLKYKGHPYNQYYSTKYGDTIKMHIHKNGSIKREYFNSGKLGLDWTIYDSIKNIEYAKWHSMDSIFFYECSEVVTELKELKRDKDTLIQGKNCISITAKEYEPKGKENVIKKFYFSGDESLAPNVYSKYKDGYMDRIYNLSKSHFIRKEMDLKFTYLIFDAVEIKEQVIDLKKFEIPVGHILVDY
ncbi:MAG: hypothetical protein AB8F94_02265 [Saprospiraceae bacterium]